MIIDLPRFITAERPSWTELEQFLVSTPEKFDALGRTASYGSWLNFYLCETLLTTDPPQHYDNDDPRCQG